jgi:hypothetical protein
MKTLKEKMAHIVAAVGATDGHRLVLEAYNTEIVAVRLGRLEETGPIKVSQPKRDLLQFAVNRVYEVVCILNEDGPAAE